MDSYLRGYTGLFAELGKRLSGFGGESVSRSVIEAAVAENRWFSHGDIVMAVEALREQMLDIRKLDEFAEHCKAKSYLRRQSKDVAVIMAGNIPLVGFADLLYVILSGNCCFVKPSSKDRVLIDYVIGILRDIDPYVKIFAYDDGREYDAAIATGSDSANLFFNRQFASIPLLSRGSRYSAAVLDGGETLAELKNLSGDIFSYSGLGCRSVSLLYLPSGYDAERLAQTLSSNRKNINGLCLGEYRQAKALAIMQDEDFIDGQTFIMKPGDCFPDRVGIINYEFYGSAGELRKTLEANRTKLQCLVSRGSIEEYTHVPFGRAQYPGLLDFADNKDVMEFLANA